MRRVSVRRRDLAAAAPHARWPVATRPSTAVTRRPVNARGRPGITLRLISSYDKGGYVAREQHRLVTAIDRAAAKDSGPDEGFVK